MESHLDLTSVALPESIFVGDICSRKDCPNYGLLAMCKEAMELDKDTSTTPNASYELHIDAKILQLSDKHFNSVQMAGNAGKVALENCMSELAQYIHNHK